MHQGTGSYPRRTSQNTSSWRFDQKPRTSRSHFFKLVKGLDRALLEDCYQQAFSINSISDVAHHLLNEAIAAINVQSKLQQPYLLAKILNVETKMLYDTGADVCCLSEELFKQITPKSLLHNQSQTQKFKAARGHHLHMLGNFKLPLALGRKTLRDQFFVICNLAEPAILGINFVENTG